MKKKKNVDFGLSSLHDWIRCFQCCLHLFYKSDIKKWKDKAEDCEKIS